MKTIAEKIMLHKHVYSALNEEIPAYRITLMEWDKIFSKLKQSGMVPDGASFLNISEYYGVPIELVVKVN